MLERSTERKVSLSVSLPIDLVTVIDRIADSESLSFAKIHVRVLRKGLEIERSEREAKAAKG